MLEIGDTTLSLPLIGVTTALILYYLLREKANKYPPGPLAFPVVGNLPQLALAGSLTAFSNRYRKTYGDVFTFTFGKNMRVVISGYDTMRHLLLKNADFTSNRTTAMLSKDLQKTMKEIPGVFWAPFPHWKTLRSFAISTLREEGMGKASLEPEIQEEIGHYLSTFIEPNLGKPIQLKKGLSQATSNIISQLVLGKRRDYDDVNFNKMVDAIEESVAIAVKQSVLSSLPDWVGKVFARSLAEKAQYHSEKVARPIMQSYVDEHKVELDMANPRDIVDRFLIHSAKENKEPCFSEANCRTFAIHLYSAGTDTTATALTWGMLFMCLHPETQQTVQQEIDDMIGRDRPASCKDRADMPYTDAVLLETLRHGNIAPTALPHTLEKDMVVDGVLIPAGAELMLNMSSVLNDETVFEEPDKFKPERYLTGDIALKKQRTIAFGIGRRACLGESLAKMELFIFFTTFLQKYSVRLPEGSTACMESVESIIRSPKPYDIIFTSR